MSTWSTIAHFQSFTHVVFRATLTRNLAWKGFIWHTVWHYFTLACTLIFFMRYWGPSSSHAHSHLRGKYSLSSYLCFVVIFFIYYLTLFICQHLHTLTFLFTLYLSSHIILNKHIHCNTIPVAQWRSVTMGPRESTKKVTNLRNRRWPSTLLLSKCCGTTLIQ